MSAVFVIYPVLLNSVLVVNPHAAVTVYICFQANFTLINSTRIAKMFCGGCFIVNLIKF